MTGNALTVKGPAPAGSLPIHSRIFFPFTCEWQHKTITQTNQKKTRKSQNTSKATTNNTSNDK